jgi:iron-sulfur cluster assembly protein
VRGWNRENSGRGHFVDLCLQFSKVYTPWYFFLRSLAFMILNPDHVLRVTKESVGEPPRRFSLLKWRYGKGSKPEWLNAKDLTSKIYAHEREILKHGHVRWAAVVHANSTLYVPGHGTSGAQVVYSPTGEAPLEALLAIAQRCFALKATTPDDPEELRLANMLTNEMERALDWSIPKTLSDGRTVVTTIIMTPRELIPGGILANSFFPILAERKTRLGVLVPSYYWEAEFRCDWQLEADARIAEWKSAALAEGSSRTGEGVTLTAAAAKRVRDIFRDQSLNLKTTWLRVGVIEQPDGGYRHDLKFESHTNKKQDICSESQGIQIVLDRKSLAFLAGTTIDFKIRETESGFVFDNPNVERR